MRREGVGMPCRQEIVLLVLAVVQGWLAFIAMLAWWNFTLDGEALFSVLFGLAAYLAGSQFYRAIEAAGSWRHRRLRRI